MSAGRGRGLSQAFGSLSVFGFRVGQSLLRVFSVVVGLAAWTMAVGGSAPLVIHFASGGAYGQTAFDILRSSSWTSLSVAYEQGGVPWRFVAALVGVPLLWLSGVCWVVTRPGGTMLVLLRAPFDAVSFLCLGVIRGGKMAWLRAGWPRPERAASAAQPVVLGGLPDQAPMAVSPVSVPTNVRAEAPAKVTPPPAVEAVVMPSGIRVVEGGRGKPAGRPARDKAPEAGQRPGDAGKPGIVAAVLGKAREGAASDQDARIARVQSAVAQIVKAPPATPALTSRTPDVEDGGWDALLPRRDGAGARGPTPASSLGAPSIEPSGDGGADGSDVPEWMEEVPLGEIEGYPGEPDSDDVLPPVGTAVPLQQLAVPGLVDGAKSPTGPIGGVALSADLGMAPSVDALPDQKPAFALAPPLKRDEFEKLEFDDVLVGADFEKAASRQAQAVTDMLQLFGREGRKLGAGMEHSKSGYRVDVEALVHELVAQARAEKTTFDRWERGFVRFAEGADALEAMLGADWWSSYLYCAVGKVLLRDISSVAVLRSLAFGRAYRDIARHLTGIKSAINAEDAGRKSAAE